MNLRLVLKSYRHRITSYNVCYTKLLRASPISVSFINETTCPDCVLTLANSIDVVGNYAYITSYNEEGIEILDISDPTNPTHVGSILDNACDTAVGGSGCALSYP